MTAKLQARDDAAVLRVFSLVANAISRDQRAAYKLFATHDRNGNGSLEPTELASFLKALVPKTSAADLTAVLTYIQMADANGNGRIEWRELLQAVRALPVKTPRITLKPAYKPSFGLYWSPDAVQPAAGVDGASGDWPPSPIAHRPSGEADLELQLVAQQDGNLVDRESGAVYAPPAPGAGRGAWPVLIGHTDPMSRQFVPLTSLPSLTMFDDLLVIIQSPQGGKQFQDRWAAAAAKSSGGGMRGSRVGLAGAAAGAPKLKVPAILDVLLSMDEFTAQEAALLSALMRMFGGDEAHPPEDILTALTMSQQVHRQHFCPPSNYALQVLSSLSQALAGNAQAATAAAARLAPASGGLRGQLDADGLEGLMKAMLGQNGADDPALTVLVMFLGSRYPAFKGTFAVRDIFKLLRAVRCRLPGAPKGLLAGAFDVTAIVPPSAAAASPGPVPYVDQPQNSGSRINMVYSIGGRGTEGGASTSDLLRGADSYTWGSRQQRSTSAGGRALPPPPPPTCDPHRRIVELKPHQHTDGQYYAVDPVTGLLYRIAEGGEWPELVGKLLPAGQRVQPASQGGLETVCDALGRLAADEKRLEATFKMFDRDNKCVAAFLLRPSVRVRVRLPLLFLLAAQLTKTP